MSAWGCVFYIVWSGIASLCRWQLSSSTSENGYATLSSGEEDFRVETSKYQSPGLGIDLNSGGKEERQCI